NRMNRYKTVIPGLFFCILLTACAAQLTKDIEVTAKQRPGFDPTRYKTYAWLDTAQIVNDPLGKWEPPDFDADAEVTRLVDRELAKQGISRTTDNPQILVTFIAGIDMIALQLREDPEKGKETLQSIPRGALVVVLVDAVSRERLWVGVAGSDVGKQPDSTAVRRRLDYAITEMFRRLPANN
ncbi:MAG: DUF4136 domain-containing protein, partial [Gammaproteobacteria bacterium]